MSNEEKIFHDFGRMVLSMIEDVLSASVTTGSSRTYGRSHITMRGDHTIDLIVATSEAADEMERLIRDTEDQVVTYDRRLKVDLN